MTLSTSFADRMRGAIFGMFIGDALAMPVHWYYDTRALHRDYGEITSYLKPRNPHPDSILWRSSFPPQTGVADILHEQRQYWGVKGIHYNQFLQAGENTLNVKLARELLIFLKENGNYNAELWLEKMVSFLVTPGNHQDTYIEEYLRHFITTYGKNKKMIDCGRKDEKHIGGFSLMLPLTIACGHQSDYAKNLSLKHLALTHGGSSMKAWGMMIVAILLNALNGNSMKDAIAAAAEEAKIKMDIDQFVSLADYPDITVVTKHFSSACYVDYAVPATVFLALKYENSPEKGMIANTMCGGDNVGRGAVLGALLGAVHGMKGWPAKWVDGLVQPPPDIGQILPGHDNR
jgi:ADP-ribosyl-[dinitrogen reductase] hydrolase